MRLVKTLLEEALFFRGRIVIHLAPPFDMGGMCLSPDGWVGWVLGGALVGVVWGFGFGGGPCFAFLRVVGVGACWLCSVLVGLFVARGGAWCVWCWGVVRGGVGGPWVANGAAGVDAGPCGDSGGGIEVGEGRRRRQGEGGMVGFLGCDETGSGLFDCPSTSIKAMQLWSCGMILKTQF